MPYGPMPEVSKGFLRGIEPMVYLYVVLRSSAKKAGGGLCMMQWMAQENDPVVHSMYLWFTVSLYSPVLVSRTMEP